MRLFLCLAAVLALSACGLRSGLHIQGRTQFDLGHNAHGAYTAQIDNVGSAPIVLVLDGESLGELAPGEALKQRVPAQSQLSLVNTTRRHGRLDVQLRGDTGLSMAYSPAPGDTGPEQDDTATSR